MDEEVRLTAQAERDAARVPGPKCHGLERRHVKELSIEWADSPPRFIQEARRDDIMRALRIGFDALDAALLRSEARLRVALNQPETKAEHECPGGSCVFHR